RLQYQSYALSPAQGVNELRFTLGKGWYCGKLGFDPQPNNYGERTALLALLILDYADGTEERIGTDESWSVSTGAIRFSEIYDGETQDTTLEEAAQGQAVLLEKGFETLVGQENEPVRCLMRLDAEKSFVTPKGELVYDFGQNLTGWVELRITGKAGQTLTLHHAEALDENGNFYTGNLSFAKATDSYILNGREQTLRPHFTFHGFRYLWVEGLEEGQQAVFTACHLSTDLRQSGSFECSNTLVNRLQQNIQWSQRDNYLDVPTDCPQRSERLGWTGDATAFGPTAAFNENILPFMRKWLRDLRSEQTKAIGMPQVVPNIMGVGQSGAAYWGDVATVLPWTLYRAYGDKRILAEQFESMKLWVDYISAQCGENGLWQSGFQYGDWLGLDAEMNALNEPRKGATEDYFAANACYLWSLRILADTAALLGEREEENRYRELREKVLAAFREEYITATGRLVCETQTAMILALHLDLVEEKHRARIAAMLKANIEAHRTHLVTGFIGTPYACLTLSDNGMHELAGKLLLQEQNPSWLYEVKMGATTIWERWDSILPDGSFNPANMNSLNHYAYGSIGSWLYTKLAGLEIVEPGYKKFSVRPQFIRGVEWVKLRYDSVYGPIRVEWSCEKRRIRMEVEIPANTSAVLTLPEKEERIELGSGVYVYEYDTETDLSLARYRMEMPLRVMLEHPVGKAMLAQYMPEMVDNPMIQYVIDEPITALLAYAPQAQPLYEAIIAAMNGADA
ncbi:MAG: family 78 glycoside hydrolase catalytic domain, partial [Oscillospiraceae bacterium]|nr:family 78 glycoside hydrolase catalytic domain [Oscillospiraceae bacterium]